MGKNQYGGKVKHIGYAYKDTGTMIPDTWSDFAIITMMQHGLIEKVYEPEESE